MAWTGLTLCAFVLTIFPDILGDSKKVISSLCSWFDREPWTLCVLMNNS